MSLPESYYNQFNSVYGNGQSRLLQAVRQAILVPYPRSEVRADGQVVKINFSDGMFFEILPAFKNWDGSYRYPDTNMGGNWRSTNTYERILLDCYNQHFMWGAMPLSAPGSNQQVSTDNSRDCLGKVLRYIAD